MSAKDGLNLREGAIVALPFFENEKFVVGSKRGGGMGNVYQLVPLLPGALPFALKTYQGEGDYEQFEREAQIWMSLGAHPNVARAITYGMLDGVRCILANWYPRNLSDLKFDSLSKEDILRVASGIVIGLKDGYEEHGLIHKDIKPSNILIDSVGVPRLADFGISSIAPPNPTLQRQYAETSEIGEPNYDKNSIVSGTPIYMAPELFRGAKNSISSDIFALGIALFEWLTGTHPYLPSNEGLNYSRMPHLADAIRGRYGDALEPLIKLIALAIQLRPDERPRTYDQLLEDSSFSPVAADRNAELLKPKPSTLRVISRAQVLRRQGKSREAVGLVKRELEKQPNDVLLLTTYATTLIRVGQLSIALPYLERAVALNRTDKNRYLGQPYVEPNVNLALLLLSAAKFHEAAAILREAADWLNPAESDLSLTYWEFGWLYLYEGRMEKAAQQLLYYIARRSAIEPVMAIFCLAAFMLPNSKDYFRKCFDLFSAAGCSEVLVGQYFCVVASYLDAERMHKFRGHLLTPKLASELEKMSVAISGVRDGFKVPMTDQAIRRLLLSVDDKFYGGKYRGNL